MNKATFFLSTGRCGTQWLADNIGRFYADLIWAEHEPLHDAYFPRKLCGVNDPALLDEGGPALRHLDQVEAGLAAKPYVEFGWPCRAAIPWIAERLKGRVRVVHLVRHPVYTALSWLTQQAFCPPDYPRYP